MSYLFQILLIFSLATRYNHSLALKTVVGRELTPSVIAVSNTSASRSMNGQSLSTAFLSQSTVNSRFQSDKAKACDIKDNYCNNSRISNTANVTDLDDLCVLWDPSCSSNGTLAANRFFNQTFQNDLFGNVCFTQVNYTDSVGVSKCDEFNPPKRMFEFREMRNWMRSKQCVSAAANWAARTPGDVNFTYANAKDWKISREDPDTQMEAQMYPDSINYTSGVAPSCCGVCNVYSQNVDIYYWPEPDTNTSCLSIIGGSIRPLDYGATKTEVSLNTTETSTATYWGCNPRTSTFYNPMERGNVTYTTATTTAQITTIGSLLVKVPVVNPWSSSPCLESGQISRGSNKSTDIRDKHAPIHARDHALMTTSSFPRSNGSAVKTIVSGSFTFTSPSLYAQFHGITATDQCGGIIISSTMIAFAPGELATLDGPLALPNQGGLLATKSFDFNDLPCPPQSVMENHWYKPEPGEPYRPLIAMPSRIKQIEPWLSYCTEIFFTAYDPPMAITAATALAPPVPKSDPNTHPNAPVPSLTVDPGARQTVGLKWSPPVPASIPRMEQPIATINPAPASSDQQEPDNSPQPSSPAAQKSPPSQSNANTAEQNNENQESHDPQQTKNTQQDNDLSQANDSRKPDDPKKGSGGSADPKHVANPQSNKDLDPADDGTSSPDRSATPDPQTNDLKHPDVLNSFNEFIEGQPKTVNNVAVQPLSHGISVAGYTLTPGASPITVSGTPIRLDPSNLVIGKSTVPLALEVPTPMTTMIAGHVVTAALDSIAIAGSTLTRGASPITISGTPIYFGSSALIIGTSTVPLITPAPKQIITTIAGQAITAASNMISLAGMTLSPGAPGMTLDGTLLSLDTASHLIAGSKTLSFESASPSSITTTIGGRLITAASDKIAIAGTVLTPGASSVVVGGTPISLNAASQFIIGSKTIALQSGTTDLGGLTIMGGLGIDINGTPISLNTAAQLAVVGSNNTIPSPTTQGTIILSTTTGGAVNNGSSPRVQIFQGGSAAATWWKDTAKLVIVLVVVVATAALL